VSQNMAHEDEVRADFDRARRSAFLHGLRSAVNRRPNDLIPYQEVRRRVAPEGESYRGVQTVRLDQIVGSMDRYRDFDREFLPRQRHTASRWQNVDRAYYQDRQLPPIQLYRVGDIYFVKDGNHRVSVARQRGQEYIDAEVIEGHIRAPLYASMTPKELLLQAEYAEFLRRTDLDKLRPDHDIRPTDLGRYDEIWEQIQRHGEWLASIWHRPVTVAEQVVDWYDFIYCPIVDVIRQERVLGLFSGHTEADLYLWVMHHRHHLWERYGFDIGPAASAADYVDTVSSRRSGAYRLGLALRNVLRFPFRGRRRGAAG